MKSRSILGAIVLALIASLFTPVNAQAAPVPVGKWSLTTPSNGTDLTGKGHTLSVDPVQNGVTFSSTGAYFNEYGRLNSPWKTDFQPGTRPFSFGFSLLGTDTHANLMQWGTEQGGTQVNQILKIEISYQKSQAVHGAPRCRITGSLGTINLIWAVNVADGRWHDIRCERLDAGTFQMVVDGVVVSKRRNAQVGFIDLKGDPLAVGSKPGDVRTDINDRWKGYMKNVFYNVENPATLKTNYALAS